MGKLTKFRERIHDLHQHKSEEAKGQRAFQANETNTSPKKRRTHHHHHHHGFKKDNSVQLIEVDFLESQIHPKKVPEPQKAHVTAGPNYYANSFPGSTAVVNKPTPRVIAANATLDPNPILMPSNPLDSTPTANVSNAFYNKLFSTSPPPFMRTDTSTAQFSKLHAEFAPQPAPELQQQPHSYQASQMATSFTGLQNSAALQPQGSHTVCIPVPRMPPTPPIHAQSLQTKPQQPSLHTSAFRTLPTKQVPQAAPSVMPSPFVGAPSMKSPFVTSSTTPPSVAPPPMAPPTIAPPPTLVTPPLLATNPLQSQVSGLKTFNHVTPPPPLSLTPLPLPVPADSHKLAVPWAPTPTQPAALETPTVVPRIAPSQVPLRVAAPTRIPIAQAASMFGPRTTAPIPAMHTVPPSAPRAAPPTAPRTTAPVVQRAAPPLVPPRSIPSAAPVSLLPTAASRPAATTTARKSRDWQPDSFIKDFVKFQSNLEPKSLPEPDDHYIEEVVPNEFATVSINTPQEEEVIPTLDLTDDTDEYDYTKQAHNYEYSTYEEEFVPVRPIHTHHAAPVVPAVQQVHDAHDGAPSPPPSSPGFSRPPPPTPPTTPIEQDWWEREPAPVAPSAFFNSSVQVAQPTLPESKVMPAALSISSERIAPPTPMEQPADLPAPSEGRYQLLMDIVKGKQLRKVSAPAQPTNHSLLKEASQHDVEHYIPPPPPMPDNINLHIAAKLASRRTAMDEEDEDDEATWEEDF